MAQMLISARKRLRIRSTGPGTRKDWGPATDRESMVVMILGLDSSWV